MLFEQKFTNTLFLKDLIYMYSGMTPVSVILLYGCVFHGHPIHVV